VSGKHKNFKDLKSWEGGGLRFKNQNHLGYFDLKLRVYKVGQILEKK